MKVLGVGSNFAHHALEMGGAVPRTPLWFWKQDSAIVHDGEPVVLAAGPTMRAGVVGHVELRNPIVAA